MTIPFFVGLQGVINGSHNTFEIFFSISVKEEKALNEFKFLDGFSLVELFEQMGIG